MNKLLSTIASLLCAVSLIAQHDTLVHSTSEVEIQAQRNPKYTSPILRPELFDPKKAPLQIDLGGWLERMGLAQINRNGAPGSAATVRFRGLSSDHTQLLWNGIPINSIALGTCDLSMLPAFLFDGMFYSEGAGVNSNLTPAIGSTMNLVNFEKDSTLSCAITGGYNSLLNQHLAADIHIAKKITKKNFILNARTKVFDQIYQNKFLYVDTYRLEKPRTEQVHNNGRNSGFTQDLSLKWRNHFIKASFWHQQRDAELPVMMGFDQNSQVYQEDQFNRAGITYQLSQGKTFLQMGYAFNNEKLHWMDKENNLLDSRYSIQSQIASFLLIRKFGSYFKMQLNGAASANFVLNSGYGTKGIDVNSGQTGLTMMHTRGVHHTEISGRMDLRSSSSIPSYSFQHSIKPKWKAGRELELQFCASQKVRLPDFNELYWNPGGNAQLRPERGNCAIISTNYSQKIAPNLELRARFQLYYNDIKDWIQWQPATSQIWSPVNIRHVKTKGCELRLGLTKALPKGEIEVNSMAEVNTAQGKNMDASISWFTMVYSPKYRTNTSLTIRHLKSSCSFHYLTTSSRFTDEENTVLRALPSYQLIHGMLTREFSFKSTKSFLSLGVDNLLNVRYESVRGYALPGRVFSIQFKLLIS